MDKRAPVIVLPSTSTPFIFLASFDYSFAPRRASRIPFPPLFFFFFFLLDGVRRAAKNSLVAATSEGGIDSFRRPASSPPLPQYFHLLLLPLLPSTNCFFSINFVSWDAYRLHEQLPRRLPPAISLSLSLSSRLLIARPIVLLALVSSQKLYFARIVMIS